MQRWTPPLALSAQEKMLMKRLTRVRALFGFLPDNTGASCSTTLSRIQPEGMYRGQREPGDDPHPPALLCMVVLLQGYVGASMPRPLSCPW